MHKLSSAETNLISQQKYAIVDFYADWCGPCKLLGPELEKAEPDITALNVAGFKVNVDECDQFAIQNKIQFVPTVIFFKDGVEKDRFVGMRKKDEIVLFVKNNL